MMERIGAVPIIGLLYQADNVRQQIAIINRLGAQTLLFAGFDIFQISVIRAIISLLSCCLEKLLLRRFR